MSDDLCPACGAYWACECPGRADEPPSMAISIDPDEWYHLQREVVVQTERLRRMPALGVHTGGCALGVSG